MRRGKRGRSKRWVNDNDFTSERGFVIVAVCIIFVLAWMVAWM
jgi:hypothetical protein